MKNDKGTEIDSRYLRGETIGTDVGFIVPAVGYKNPGATPNLRGVEGNTAAYVKEAPLITGITPVEYAAPTDAPEVIPFDTYGDD